MEGSLESVERRLYHEKDMLQTDPWSVWISSLYVRIRSIAPGIYMKSVASV